MGLSPGSGRSCVFDFVLLLFMLFVMAVCFSSTDDLDPEPTGGS